MSRSPAKSGNATAMKSLKEKWLSIVQSAEEKGEKEIGGSSTVTHVIVILGVASLDLWHRFARRVCRVAWMSHAWYHVTREMGRGPTVP